MTFLVLVLILLAFGLLMLFSASYAYAQYYQGDSFHYIKKQALVAVIGVACMLIVSKIDYTIYKKYTYWIYGGAIFLLVLVLLVNIKNSIKRWIYVPGVGQFQPSEVAKFALIVLFAYLIAKHGEKMNTFQYGVFPFVLFLGITAGLIIIEPHLSGTILIMGIGLIMMFVGGTRYRWFILLLVAAAVGVVLVLTFGREYMAERLQGWFDPFSDPQDSTYQTMESLLTIGSGGLLGVGLGNSRQKYLFLPEPQNDFIFAIICEELGFIGAMVVILLFVLFVYRGFAIAAKAPDKFSMMLAVGITTQIGLQAMLNIAVVTNTIPNTGISLPFFSYGGTALFLQLLEMGVILNVSRHASLEKE
ncbi:MAG TPA: putative lipid II flippase FtsW [Firmicutes bacterium]|nr:putative lipid II flippase FtsW [Bacillota bacterium]